MVECELGLNCIREQWYHPECLGIDASKLPDTWYCCGDCRAKGTNSQVSDGVLTYAKSLLGQGLNHLARRLVIRKGDGPAIINFWRIDMLQFCTRNHMKYLILSHNLLIGINGFSAPRISHDLVWNRVANLTGNKDSNIAIDLVNEMINNSYKDILKRAHSRYTAAEVNRSSILCGPFGKCLDDVFLSTLKRKADVVHSSNNNLYLKDVQDFILRYSHDKLFKHTPGRFHPTFANTTLNSAIKEPQKLGERLRDYTRVLDLRKDIIPNQVNPSVNIQNSCARQAVVKTRFRTSIYNIALVRSGAVTNS